MNCRQTFPPSADISPNYHRREKRQSYTRIKVTVLIEEIPVFDRSTMLPILVDAPDEWRPARSRIKALRAAVANGVSTEKL